MQRMDNPAPRRPRVIPPDGIPDSGGTHPWLASIIQQTREQEREHLSRELHDVLGCELMAARLQVASLNARLAGRCDDIDRRLADLASTLAAAQNLKRRIIDGLEPPMLQQVGLAASLRVMVSDVERRSGVRFVLDLDDVADTRPVQLALFRLVQEALTNTVKYASATEGEVVLRNREREITVFVRDNGKGFDPARDGHGHGLRGMRQRIEDAGGHLTVESSPGTGTRIAATLPRTGSRLPR